MLSKWPIRNKLLVGLGLLLVLVATLSASGFLAMYSYRHLVKSLSGRAAELPLATELSKRVSDLRVTMGESRPLRDISAAAQIHPALDAKVLCRQFHNHLQAVFDAVDNYVQQISSGHNTDSEIGDHSHEEQTVAKIQDSLAAIDRVEGDELWVLDRTKADKINVELETLQNLAAELPSHLQQRIHDLAGDVRTQYRTVIILSWVITISAGCFFLLLVHLVYRWIFRPLNVLVAGSRRMAAGEFNYRIRLDTHDEMSELATALNDMTARFNAIRADLDRQVQERTKQVVRSEQLASVGFLAAGVAHEINNPLASIAMCAESLESRLLDLVANAPGKKGDGHVATRPVPGITEISSEPVPFFSTLPVGEGRGEANDLEPDRDEEATLVRHYLRMIQDEAFRCKEITEKLLDFSRMGEVKRQHVDLRELVQGVIDMVRHLGKYQQKNIQFIPGDPVIAAVNAQEMKQVALNLMTNALDSLETGGTLTIELAPGLEQVELLFTDDGCGMTDDVLQHLFEPFFTRKRGGQGTGLGLSIVYRIVAEHEGQIDARSAGPGLGSQFRVVLPLTPTQPQQKSKETHHRYQAA